MIYLFNRNIFRRIHHLQLKHFEVYIFFAEFTFTKSVNVLLFFLQFVNQKNYLIVFARRIHHFAVGSGVGTFFFLVKKFGIYFQDKSR
jgi:hypothetical protein